ncbi:type IV secretion system protein TraC [Paracoccus sp. T5]|uniref:type IV secretion system protein TraC n=1 Tax=Paracoccus sp. T5 TaxID=3402161 RepID=UPI003ADCC5BD
MFDFKPYTRVSEYLPWLAYDDTSQTFVLDGNYVGFTISALPLSSFDSTIAKRFAQLLKYEYPKHSYLQLNLLVLDDVSDHVVAMLKAREGDKDPLIAEATAKTVDFIRRGASGGAQGLAVRNSTLLISFKMPTKEMLPNEEELLLVQKIKREILEILNTIGFSQLRVANDTELAYQLSQILNRSKDASWRQGRNPVDESVFIRDQILDYDATVTVKEKAVRVGDSWITSLSPKKLPHRSYFGIAERLSVDPISGDRGIPCNHMISATVKFEDISEMRPRLERNRQYYRNYADGPFGRIRPEYRHRHEDWSHLMDMVGEGEQVHRFSLNILLFSGSDQEAERHSTTTRTYLNEVGFAFMEDAGVTFNMIRSNLPLGPEKNDQRDLMRLRMNYTLAIATFMPVFFEWRGTKTPLISLVGRGGQVMGFSPFDSGTNYNLTVSAESGAGKSFFSNELISAMLATGGRVWVIDVGRSYVKLCESLGGQFMAFGQNANICLNPFSTLKTPEEFAEVQDILLHLLSTMAAPKDGLSDFQTSILRQILGEQYDLHGADLCIDHIADACLQAAQEQGEGADKEFREKRISDISYGLRAFCKAGQFGRYFNGPSNIDFTSNFVLLELEELKNQKHLQTVVLLLLIYQIQNGMYLGEIDAKKLMLIDEAWDLMSEPQIAKFIEAGYRRFRKYNGSACIVTQALTDLHDTTTGRAILANSAMTVMLQQKPATLDKLASGDNPEFSKGLCERLKTVRTVKGRFSEIFVRTSEGMGIGRFVVDPFRALLYSTHPDDVSEIKKLTRQGYSTKEAINLIIEARGRG